MSDIRICVLCTRPEFAGDPPKPTHPADYEVKGGLPLCRVFATPKVST